MVLQYGMRRLLDFRIKNGPEFMVNLSLFVQENRLKVQWNRARKN